MGAGELQSTSNLLPAQNVPNKKHINSSPRKKPRGFFNGRIREDSNPPEYVLTVLAERLSKRGALNPLGHPIPKFKLDNFTPY